MISKLACLSMAVLTLAVGACSASGSVASGGAATTAPTQPPVANLQPTAVVATPTPEPSASGAASPSPGGVASAAPTAGALNPCSLLRQAEASQLIGVTLGPGKHQIVDPDTVCTYAKGATEVKVFLTAPTDPATAKAYYESHKSQIPPEAHITELPSFFDGAVIARASTPIGTISGIYVLDGTNFFELYCGLPACSDNALKGGAQLIAGRLP